MPFSPRQKGSRRSTKSGEEEYVVFLQGVSETPYTATTIYWTIWSNDYIDSTTMSVAGVERPRPTNCASHTTGGRVR